MKRIELALTPLSVLLIISCSAIIYASEVKITADYPEANDQFGYSVSISGNYAIVGAHQNSSFRGAAYIFYYGGAAWDIQDTLKASDGTAGDYFGESVSISGDSVAIVGAVGKTAAYIFRRSDTSWVQEDILTGSGQFARSVSISGDYAIVGEYQDDVFAGAAYIFERNGTSWSQQAKLTASDGVTLDFFGYSVSISGDYAIVGAYQKNGTGDDRGAAYIFEKPGEGWADMTETAQLRASDGVLGDQFGYSVSISGDYAIVGANQDDSKKGSAYTFYRGAGTWGQQAKLTASDGAANDEFGHSVSISGDYALVGAWKDESTAGSAYSFLRSGTSWDEKSKATASDGVAGDLFGCSVSIGGDYAIVGAYGDSTSGQNDNNRGAAYIYHSIDDLSLPVELSSFTAEPGDGEVTLEWVTESETNNLGFNIYRNLSENGSYTKVNDKLIKGSGNSTFQNFYFFKDVDLSNGVAYWYKLEDVSFEGRTIMYGPVIVIPTAKPMPERYALYQNYPNPFNAETVIRYALPKNGHVRLLIFDIMGRKVDVLVDGDMSSGYHSISWNSRNLASNIYVYQLEVDGRVTETRKMILMK